MLICIFNYVKRAGSTEASVLSPLVLGLAVTATLLALTVAGILAALYRKHSGGRAGSPKHAPIVCEPPNASATTPVHSHTKQPTDDIDPDIIPNEYGKFFFFVIYSIWIFDNIDIN